MANQIVISSGAKVRNLNGVLTGTTGVVNSLGINVANGIPQLDGSGKILVSQLPNSVMEYKGTWNAATNTPTLVNGTGNQGDVYLCNVAGTVNFGAGAITFAVGDQAIYSGTIWQKAGGSTGTVTSVAVTETGDALTITGSPITTSGTINIGFAGISGQYVNGAGGLTTFPTLISSIGLSMPSAFTVTNSPLTANGTIAVTGAGTTAQYVRGDGSLATFPTVANEAERLITEVYNDSGATLTKGTVVYINGGQGNLPTVAKALATGDATSAQTYGVVQTDITNMNNGFVVVIGSLTDLDTQAYANGTQLYLSSTVAGAWTSVKQYAPAHLVYVAIVTRSHPTQGVVEVRIQNGFEMDELHNVAAQSPSNGSLLQYVSSTSLWTAVAGTTTNIAEGTNLYFTDTRARNAISLTTTGTSGVATYSGGVLNIPNYGSALSGYVPYTGATTNVDLGAYNLTSTNLISKQLTINTTSNYGGSVILESGSLGVTGSATNGITLAANSNTVFRITSVIGGSQFRFAQFNLASLGNGQTRTYTLPDADGTVALTSDLSSYLPLTGGTLSGALNINLGSGTGLNVASDLVVFRASTGFATPRQITLAAGNGATTYLEAKGYGANYITDFGIRTYNASGTAFEVFFATSAGNVGIGNTAPAAKLDVNGAGRFIGAITIGTDFAQLLPITALNSQFLTGCYYDGSNIIATAASGTRTIYNSGGFDFRNFTGATIGSSVTDTSRMVITSGGNVGIGTSAPTDYSGFTTLHINGKSGNQGGLIRLTAFNDSSSVNIYASDGIKFNTTSAVPYIFLTQDTERMRIMAGGKILFGNGLTSDFGAGHLCIQADQTAENGIAMRNTNGGNNGNYMVFQNSGGGQSGSISQTGATSVNYGSGSDYRLKEDLKEFNGLDKVLAIKTYDFKWINENKRDYGVLAHELQEIIASAVVGEKDDLYEDETIKTQMVDYSKIVPILVKAIQELNEKIKQLENK